MHAVRLLLDSVLDYAGLFPPAKLDMAPTVANFARYRRSPAPVISAFRDHLNRHGVTCTTRRTRGDDIDAACGQLVGRVADRTTVRLGQKNFSLDVQAGAA